MAFAQISAIFASNPPGPLPIADLEAMESAYMTYRKDYNRISVLFRQFFSVPQEICILSDIKLVSNQPDEALHCGRYRTAVCFTKFGPRCTALST